MTKEKEIKKEPIKDNEKIVKKSSYPKKKLLFTQKVLSEINKFINRQTMVDLKKKNS